MKKLILAVFLLVVAGDANAQNAHEQYLVPGISIIDSLSRADTCVTDWFIPQFTSYTMLESVKVYVLSSEEDTVFVWRKWRVAASSTTLDSIKSVMPVHQFAYYGGGELIDSLGRVPMNLIAGTSWFHADFTIPGPITMPFQFRSLAGTAYRPDRKWIFKITPVYRIY